MGDHPDDDWLPDLAPEPDDFGADPPFDLDPPSSGLDDSPAEPWEHPGEVDVSGWDGSEPPTWDGSDPTWVSSEWGAPEDAPERETDWATAHEPTSDWSSDLHVALEDHLVLSDDGLLVPVDLDGGDWYQGVDVTAVDPDDLIAPEDLVAIRDELSSTPVPPLSADLREELVRRAMGA